MRPGPAPAGRLITTAKPSRSSTIKIEYFENSYSRPDPLVQLLKHKGIPFEYVTITQEAWGKRKAAGDTGEFGGLPITTRDGQIQQQTLAVLRSLGIQYGYYPTNDWQKAGMIDMIVYTWGDVFDTLGKIMIFTEDSEKPAAIYAFKTGLLPQFLALCEKQLEKNGKVQKYIVGEELTIADFVLACLTFNVLKNVKCPLSGPLGPVLDNYPKFSKYTNVLSITLQDHLSTRPNYFF